MEKSANGRVFIVDVGETMVNSANLDSKNDKQKLYCKCGSTKVYSSKIMRNVVKNYDELIEDSESVASVKCDKCERVYNSSNKVCLLTPEKEELYHIKYSFEKKGKKLLLNKIKSFVTYKTSKDELSFRDVVDVLEVDTNDYSANISLNPPHDNAGSMISTSFSELNIDSAKSYNAKVDLTNISVFEEFFNYIEFINYEGLEEAFKFVKAIDKQIQDLDELRKIPFLGYLYDNNKISKVEVADGEFDYYQEVDSGFGDGSKVKRRLVFGDYLKNLEDVCEVFFSILSYNSIATILLTKGYDFFDKLVHSSNHICPSDIYDKNGATNPNKIVEVSMNMTKEGKMKHTEPAERAENKGYLKVSNTLYDNISSPTEMNILVDVYSGGFLTKTQIESLFQKYEPSRLYKLFKQLTKSRRMNAEIEIRHIEHILKCDLDTEKNDFLTTYADTINVIDLLDLKDKYIYKCRNFIQLKEMHDDLTTRFNAMKDERKAQVYVKAIEDFNDINCQIGDIVFEVVANTERLNLEGLQMQHCIYTYLDRVCDKRYLAVNATHLLSKERATAGFHRSGKKLDLDQLKGFYNSRASAEMIQATIEFCKKHKFSTNSAYDLNPDTVRQRLMPGQLDERELADLREKMRKEEEKKRKKAEKEGKKGDSTPSDTEKKTSKVEVTKPQNNTEEQDEDKGFFGRLFG